MAGRRAALHELTGRRPRDWKRRFALVTVVCNGTDYKGNGPLVQVERAARLRASLNATDLRTYALMHGYDDQSHATLQRSGWHTVDISEVGRLFAPLLWPKPGYHWPRGRLADPRQPPFVQQRLDGRCTGLKLLAWNLTAFDRLLVSDTDVCFHEQPRQWIREQWLRGEYFASGQERFNRWPSSRPYHGLNTHLMFIQPNEQLFRVLSDMGRHRSYVPYTNGEQDVVESVFAPQRPMPKLPRHGHTKRACEVCAMADRSFCPPDSAPVVLAPSASPTRRLRRSARIRPRVAAGKAG